MSTVTPNSPGHGRPTPDDLAGIPVCMDEEQPTKGVRERSVKVRGRSGNKDRGEVVAPLPKGPPTANELAGIPVTADGEADLTVLPRKPKRRPISDDKTGLL